MGNKQRGIRLLKLRGADLRGRSARGDIPSHFSLNREDRRQTAQHDAQRSQMPMSLA